MWVQEKEEGQKRLRTSASLGIRQRVKMPHAQSGRGARHPGSR